MLKYGSCFESVIDAYRPGMVRMILGLGITRFALKVRRSGGDVDLGEVAFGG